MKAALLFVNFYKEIALAWSKWKTPYFLPDDGVSIAMQIMQKQVSFISANPKLFTPTYIYKVSWNGLGAFIKSHVTDKRRYESGMSYHIEDTDAMGNTVTVNIADLVPFWDDDYEVTQAKTAIWEIIESLGPKAEKVVNHLINPTDSLRKTTRRSLGHNTDRLKDVEVTPAEYDAIMIELQDRLLPYREFFLG